MAGFYTNTSWLRVRVGSNVLQDVNGNTAYVGPNSAVLSYLYDLSAYSGQSSVYLTFETFVNYNNNYSVGGRGNYVRVDDIEVFEVLPCTYYYASSASLVSDASCNGASDGSASATAVNGLLVQIQFHYITMV